MEKLRLFLARQRGKHSCGVAVCFAFGLGLGAAIAGTPGESVVVVYNSRMPESRALADYYAQKRQVPTNQVFGFSLTTSEDISRAEFRDHLQKPLAKALSDRKLWRIEAYKTTGTNGQPEKIHRRPVASKVRYAVLCYGIPLRISPEPDLKEDGTDKMRPELRRNEAAVDSELALLPLLEEKLMLAGPLSNPAYAVTNTLALDPTNGVLMVARLDGPNAEIARGLVDKALHAEAEGLWGRAYFDLRNTTEPAYKVGDDWIRNAAEICRRLGFETVVDQNPGTFPAGFPMSQIALYEGWYDENVSGPFTLPSVEFMPGAFAYHLHSGSAHTVRSATQAWVGPLVAKGATCTMGCVFEPYLAGTPDLGVFTVRFVFSGFTFGESAYAGQPVLSWQTTVVGDPLYKPFGRDLDQLHDTLLQQHSKMLEWYYLRVVDLNLAIGKPVVECAEFLEQLDVAKKSAVLTEKLAEIYSNQGKPSSAIFEYERALKLDPSPQQRIRLMLTVAEKLAEASRDSEAYDTYARLLEEVPGYPDKPLIYQKLAALARKLNKAQEAGKWEGLLKGK